MAKVKGHIWGLEYELVQKHKVIPGMPGDFITMKYEVLTSS